MTKRREDKKKFSLLTYIRNHSLQTLVLVVYLVLAATMPDKAVTALRNSSYYLIEMVQIMPVIFLLTVSIDVLIPKSWILQNLGESSGLKGGLLALLFGSISAGPIYAAFPVTKMLLKKGAGVGNIVIILSAWAVIKVPMLANEAKFLGPAFMVTRWALTVAAIFFMGWLMGKTIKKSSMITEDKHIGSQVSVSDKYCIGCGLCAREMAELFDMNDGKAVVKDNNNNISPSILQKLKDTADRCPSAAIVVNAPASKNYK